MCNPGACLFCRSRVGRKIRARSRIRPASSNSFVNFYNGRYLLRMHANSNSEPGASIFVQDPRFGTPA